MGFSVLSAESGYLSNQPRTLPGSVCPAAMFTRRPPSARVYCIRWRRPGPSSAPPTTLDHSVRVALNPQVYADCIVQRVNLKWDTPCTASTSVPKQVAIASTCSLIVTSHHRSENCFRDFPLAFSRFMRGPATRGLLPGACFH